MHILSKIIPLPIIFAVAASPVAPPPPKPDPVQQYRSLVDKMPASVTALSNVRPSFRHEVSTSYKYLRQACPALSKVGLKSAWDLAKWMNEKITEEEWSNTPYSFRMNSFRAISVQRNTETKLSLLGKLYNVLPSHPAFQIWVDDGIERFNSALHADPYLNKEKKNWKRVNRSDNRLKKYIARVGEIAMESFLPGNEHPELKIEIKREPVGYRGQYQSSAHTVRFNFSKEKGAIKNALTADGVIIHEYFHAIENVIRDWSMGGQLKDNLPLQEMGEKFFYSSRSELAHVSNVTDFNIYRNTFLERWSYYTSRGAKKKEDMNLRTRDQAWIDKNLVANDKWPSEKGVLPAACAVK